MDRKVLKKILIVLLLFCNVYVWNIVFDYMIARPSVNFLDVNEGDSELIKSRAGNILIDMGRKNYVLRPIGKLMSFFDRTIDVAIITHSDADHFEGLLSLFDFYKVRAVVLNDFNITSDVYLKLLEELWLRKIPIVLGVKGLKINNGIGEILVMYPDLSKINLSKTNEKSIVLTYSDNKFLFTGDITSKILSAIVLENSLKDVFLIKIPHHGAKNTIDENILKQLNIKEAVISVGENYYGHPSSEVLGLLNSFKASILRTDEKGTISFVLNDGKWIKKFIPSY